MIIHSKAKSVLGAAAWSQLLHFDERNIQNTQCVLKKLCEQNSVGVLVTGTLGKAMHHNFARV